MIHYQRKNGLWLPQFKPRFPSELIRSHPLARGLVGCWLMNEGAGSKVLDLSGYGNHGTFTNDPTWQGNGINFTDTNDEYISCGTDASLKPDAYSIVARVQVNSHDNNLVYTTAIYMGLQMPGGTGSNGRALLYLNNSNWVYYETVSAYFGEMKNVAVTLPGSGQTDILNSKFYLDGVNYPIYASNTSGVQNARVSGNIGGYGNYFSGLIEFVYFYNRALSAQEIAWLHSEPYCMIREKPIRSFHIPVPTKGMWAFDQVIPESLSFPTTSDGVEANIELDVNEEAKITWDTTRHKPKAVIHDFPFYTGTVGSETDHLVGHWKCNDNAANTTIVDETGNYDGTLEGGDNTADKSDTDAVRGTSLLLNGIDDQIKLSDASAGLTSDGGFTVIIKIKPNFNYDVGSSQHIIRFTDSSESEYFLLQYNQGNDTFQIYYNDDGSYASSIPFTSNNNLQQWHTISFFVNLSEEFMGFSLNGEISRTAITLGTFSLPDSIYISSNNYTNMYIDEIKLLDGCILPYGSYFTGNGAVDVDVAHKNITFFSELNDITSPVADIAGGSSTITVHGSPTLATGVDGVSNSALECNASGEMLSFPTAGNIDISKGRISFWFKSDSAYDVDELHMLLGLRGLGLEAGDFAIYKGDNSELNRLFFIADYSLHYTSHDISGIAWTSWNHYCFIWNSQNAVYGTNYIALFINGINISVAYGVGYTSSWTPSTIDSNLGIGNDYEDTTKDMDGVMDKLTITSDPNTPEIWTAFGVPLHTPILQVE